MNTDSEIKQAFEDYRHGRMGEIPAVPIGEDPFGAIASR
jgi:hypothetical protein